MGLKTDGDFLESEVSEADPRKLVSTYRDDLNSRFSNHGDAKNAVKSTKSGGALFDGDDKLADDDARARIVVAAVEPGEDIVAVVAEEAKGVRDIGGGPLRNDFGDGAGEGHGTGGEDSEDGGETHDEEG